MSPEQIREKGVWPKGFLPLPHPNQAEGGMLFPKFHIDKVKEQDARDLTRYDLDFDLPDHFLPEYPPPIFLTTRPDLGDVSKGELVTLANYFKLFDGILNPKQLEGVRLLVTPFPQQQFNATNDRRSLKPSTGCDVLRLPCEWAFQWFDASGRRHSSPGVPPSARHAVAARK